MLEGCTALCPCICPFSPKKVAGREIFAKQSCHIYFKGDKKYIQNHAVATEVLGKAKLTYV